jgi:hypothetical protein
MLTRKSLPIADAAPVPMREPQLGVVNEFACGTSNPAERADIPIPVAQPYKLNIHRALLEADPTVFAVTEIAMDCRFRLVGDFAVMSGCIRGDAPGPTLRQAASA